MRTVMTAGLSTTPLPFRITADAALPSFRLPTSTTCTTRPPPATRPYPAAAAASSTSRSWGSGWRSNADAATDACPRSSRAIAVEGIGRGLRIGDRAHQRRRPAASAAAGGPSVCEGYIPPTPCPSGTLSKFPREVALGRSIPDSTALPGSPRALEERGFGTRPRYLIVCLWRRLLASRHILTLRGPERVLVVSTEPPDDLSCLTTPGVGRPRDGLLPVPLTRGIQMHTPSPWVCRLQH